MTKAEHIFLEVDNRQDKIQLSEDMMSLMKACIRKTMEAEGIQLPILVSMVLVDNDQIHEMNSEFRGVDKETDVLSFPMLEIDLDSGNLSLEKFCNDVDPETRALMLGDIVISLEKAKEQAEEYGHGFSRELGFLTVHSMLHLLGYDHMESEGERTMREKEESILTALQITRF